MAAEAVEHRELVAPVGQAVFLHHQGDQVPVVPADRLVRSEA